MSTSRILRGGAAPLLWHHGEPDSVIAEEIAAMRSSGLREFILEPRPHPDYLESEWWRAAAFVLEEARRSDMGVWLFDDGRFPSGWGGGKIPSQFPQLLKRYMALRVIDIRGPIRAGTLDIDAWLSGDESVLAVVAGCRNLRDDSIDASTLTDLTGAIESGLVVWDVPPGAWRICIVVDTPHGGETATRDYINPIDPRSAEAILDLVHRPHREHLGRYFGNTVRGFFQDEPRFGNSPTYDALPGQRRPEFFYESPADLERIVLPLAPGLLESLWPEPRERALALPLLWLAGDPDLTGRVRFRYMDEVSRRFGEYLGRLGTWCRSQGLQMIGHVIEDNGAHAHLGFGCGHYFRAIASQDAAGIDVVHQVHPRMDTGRSSSPFGYRNDSFFTWGLAKLASSAAHQDPQQNGAAICESFGAYGWHGGLRTMMWLTDHLLVRGINGFVPHAFSPRRDDPDAPPHFYNGGTNPQWPHFGVWVDYADRLTRLFSDVSHVSDAAVLYHAEAEWAGPAQPCEEPLEALMRHHIDADIVPSDRVVEAAGVDDTVLRVGSEVYPVLIVPRASYLPAALLRAIATLTRRGIPVLCIDERPSGSSTEALTADDVAALVSDTTVVGLGDLSKTVTQLHHPSVSIRSGTAPGLRTLHVVSGFLHRYFLFNEDVDTPVDAEVHLHGVSGVPTLIDSIEQSERTPTHSPSQHGVDVHLQLAPGQSIVIELRATGSAASTQLQPRLEVDGNWTVGLPGHPTLLDAPALAPIPRTRLPRDFSGQLSYETDFMTGEVTSAGRLVINDAREIAEVWLDSRHLGVRVRPPYSFPTGPLTAGHHSLRILVTSTHAERSGHNGYDRAVAVPAPGLVGPIEIHDTATTPPSAEAHLLPRTGQIPQREELR